MTDRPIIFSAPMVRALIEGRKFQTRRIVNGVPDMPPANCHSSHKPKHPAPYLDAYCGEPKTPANPRGMGLNWHWWQVDDRPGPTAFKLRYATGNRLWVKEAWRIDGAGSRVPAEMCRLHRAVEYRADGYEPDRHAERSPIFMPRWASRLTLTVTDVRVQRLQDITEDDAQAEGLVQAYDGWATDPAGRCWGPTARYSFVQLFDSLHGDGVWEANPWVAAISFDVHRGNIDEVQP